MKSKIFLTTVLVTLCGIAQVVFAGSTKLVNYSITGATTNWSGQFEVVDLNVPAQFMSYDDPPVDNATSVSANGWSSVGFSSPGYFFYYGSSSSGWIGWQAYDTNTYVPYGLTLQSPDLYAAVQDGNATWNDLSGHSYTITSTDNATEFAHPTEGRLTGSGGIITFSATSVPEPSTWAMIGAGVLGLLATRRRRA